MNQDKLPPYNIGLGICPQCGNYTWIVEKSDPIDSSQYSQQIYKETIGCTTCHYTYTLIRPCEPPP